MENLRDEILRLNLKSIIQTKEKLKDHIIAVSYTHLTLPTNREV